MAKKLWRFIPTESLLSTNKKDLKQIVWNLLLNLMDSVKMYSSQIESNANIKLIHSMLELIYEIVQVVKLNDENYEQMDTFLESFTKNKISSKENLGEVIAKLLLVISINTDSALSPIKCMALEQSVVNSTTNTNTSEKSTPIYDSQNKFLNSSSITNQFKFITQANSLSIHRITHESLNDWLKSLEWCIHNYKYFHMHLIMEIVSKQINMAILGLKYSLASASSLDASNLTLRSLAKFYATLTCLFKSDLVNLCSIDMIKTIVGLVYENFNCNKISIDLNRMQEIRVMNENETDSVSHLLNAIKCKDEFYTCVGRIDAFEKCLIELSEKYKEAKLMEDYELFVDNLSLNFQRGAVKVVNKNFHV